MRSCLAAARRGGGPVAAWVIVTTWAALACSTKDRPGADGAADLDMGAVLDAAPEADPDSAGDAPSGVICDPVFAVSYQGIWDAAGSCEVALPSAPPVPDRVRVLLNGAIVPPDASDDVSADASSDAGADASAGWTFGPANRSIVFRGSYCDSLNVPGQVSIQVIFGCTGGPVP